ncbi:hypothetical protein MRX96_015821 [Rhipicephalus microplus]
MKAENCDGRQHYINDWLPGQFQARFETPRQFRDQWILNSIRHDSYSCWPLPGSPGERVGIAHGCGFPAATARISPRSSGRTLWHRFWRQSPVKTCRAKSRR